MRKTLILLLIAAASVACRGRSSSMQRTQQQYEVIPEGQADGASSTVGAPGEVRPSTTATNVDTTTSFTLPATATAPGTQGGSVATTLPPAGMTAGLPGPPADTARVQTPAQQPRTVPPPPMTSASQPATETTETTGTSEAPPPEKSDTTPPPPPTVTDTRGQ